MLYLGVSGTVWKIDYRARIGIQFCCWDVSWRLDSFSMKQSLLHVICRDGQGWSRLSGPQRILFWVHINRTASVKSSKASQMMSEYIARSATILLVFFFLKMEIIHIGQAQDLHPHYLELPEMPLYQTIPGVEKCVYMHMYEYVTYSLCCHGDLM